MKLKFKKPLTPNFIKTDRGFFGVKELDETELERYIKLWSDTLRSKHALKQV